MREWVGWRESRRAVEERPRGSGPEAAAASLLGGCWSLGPAGSLIRSDHLLQEKHLLAEK